jgi:hypothetical protein
MTAKIMDLGTRLRMGPTPEWLVWKHKETGELLGPSVDFGTPATPVWAVRTFDGWREVKRDG